MKTVIIESPYKGDIKRNKEYAFKAALDSLSRGECPFGSHIFYTQFLDDSIPEQRKQGIEAGFTWWKHADLIAFYTDLGWSDGMKVAIKRCKELNKAFSIRKIKNFS
jgi:hypothetical protein